MKIEISEKDIRLLVVACSALILVLMVRLAILPALDTYEAKQIEYEEKCAQAEQMQALLDARPANESRISEAEKRLQELSAFCYEVMENRQVDELVTGAALAHDLFPSHLSISGQMEGGRAAYLYSNSGTAAVPVPEAAAAADGMSAESADVTPETAPVTATESFVRRVEASITVSGSESNAKAFLDDMENNYPAIHIKSFEMSETLYMSTELQPVAETQMRVTLEIYMYSRPTGD